MCQPVRDYHAEVDDRLPRRILPRQELYHGEGVVGEARVIVSPMEAGFIYEVVRVSYLSTPCNGFRAATRVTVYDVTKDTFNSM